MLRAGQWRSAWAWRCQQPKVRPNRAVRVGEKAGGGAGVPGVIAGGAHRAAGAAGDSGANGRIRTCPVDLEDRCTSNRGALEGEPHDDEIFGHRFNCRRCISYRMSFGACTARSGCKERLQHCESRPPRHGAAWLTTSPRHRHKSLVARNGSPKSRRPQLVLLDAQASYALWPIAACRARSALACAVRSLATSSQAKLMSTRSRECGHMRIGLWHSFSTSGLLLGTVFFATSLTPTLLPRSFLTQGVLSGCSLAAGYSIGVFGRWLWAYVELPQPKGRHLRVAKLAAATCCAVVAVTFLWRAARWQNSIRELMKLEPVDTVHPLEVALIALAVFCNPDGTRAALPADTPLRGDKS
jgi:Alpha/beta-hydrolase family N-terminus